MALPNVVSGLGVKIYGQLHRQKTKISREGRVSLKCLTLPHQLKMVSTEIRRRISLLLRSLEADKRTLPAENRFAALAPTVPAPGVVVRYPSTHMQSNFTFRIEKRMDESRRSRIPIRRTGSSSTETEKRIKAGRMSSYPPPEDFSNQQIHSTSDVGQTNLPSGCKVGPGLSKNTSQSSLPKPSPLTLEETEHSPHQSTSRRKASDLSTYPAAFDSHRDTDILHPNLPSQTPMTTGSPLNPGSPIPRVQLPPTPAHTRTPSPGSPQRGKSPAAQSLPPAIETPRRNFILVVIKNLAPKKNDVELKARQTGDGRVANEGVARAAGERGTGDGVGRKDVDSGRDAGTGEVRRDEDGRKDDEGEEWEWVE